MVTVEVLPADFDLDSSAEQGRSRFFAVKQLAKWFRVSEKTVQNDIRLAREVALPGFTASEFVSGQPLNVDQAQQIQEIRTLRRMGFKGKGLKGELFRRATEGE